MTSVDLNYEPDAKARHQCAVVRAATGAQPLSQAPEFASPCCLLVLLPAVALMVLHWHHAEVGSGDR